LALTTFEFKIQNLKDKIQKRINNFELAQSDMTIALNLTPRPKGKRHNFRGSNQSIETVVLIGNNYLTGELEDIKHYFPLCI
jgi:uncharacterized protein with ACT and thioredoxin-like domain